jgi:hypothetical protein
VTAAKIIGVHVHNGAGWQRANGGVPTGFSGPQVKDGGSWRNCDWVHAKASSAWQVTWTNINGEVPAPTIGTVLSSDFDLSPYTLDANVVLKPDGSISRKNNGVTTNNYSRWRDYDCGRPKQWHVLRDTNYTGTYNTVEPTLSTWTDFTADVTFACARSGTGFFNYEDGWAYYIRDTERADVLGGVPRGDIDIFLNSEF